MHGEIPQNVIVDDKSRVVYEVIDEEKCRNTLLYIAILASSADC